MLLKIVQAGHPVLRQRARDVTPDEVGSAALAQLIELMVATMRDAPGVGLAAPQVGVPLRLAVIEDTARYHDGVPPEELAARERTVVPLHVIINPTITVEEPETVEFFEGCLSLHGYSALVPRARAVRVHALDEKGDAREIVARGWYARILQHEIDHLDGTLYIDRMETRSFTCAEHAGRLWARRTTAEVREALGIPPRR